MGSQVDVLGEMLKFKQFIKLTSGRNTFGKKAVQNELTRIYSQKKSRDQKLKKSLTKFIYQKVSPM